MMYNGLTPIEKDTQKTREAEAAIKRCLQSLKHRYSCFLYAFNIFEPVAVKEDIEPATDGKHLFFHAEQVRGKCRENGSKWLSRTILHLLFHGIFGDFEIEEKESLMSLRSAVMDLRAEQMLQLLGYGESWYRDGNPDFYFPGLYREGCRSKKRAKRIMENGEIAKVDDHRYWFKIREEQENEDGAGAEASLAKEVAELWKQARGQVVSKGLGDGKEELSAEKLLGFMEGKGCGLSPGTKQWLEQAARGDSGDYSRILKKLLSQQEVVKEEDTIDPALYLFGLECYGDVALVEPLELSEKKKMNTLMVAVDTSGSCIDAVPVFLRETSAILKEADRIAAGGEVCYLECDAKITAECCFQNYVAAAGELAKRKVKGGGGTDFCPVFKHAEELLEGGKIIDGLFYLSDGYGRFPEQAPKYPVYFVMDRAWTEGYEPQVPDWVTVVRI